MGGTVPVAELFQRHMGLTRCSSRSRRPTKTSTRRTSSSACIACTKGSRRGRATGRSLARCAHDPGHADPSDASRDSTELAQAEARVEAHSASLKKELGVRDLVLTQILFIVGLTWIGVAGKLGPSHVVFWLLAIVLFYLPSAARRDLPQPPDAARGRAVSVGEARLQRDRRLHARVESLALRDRDHVGDRLAVRDVSLAMRIGPSAAWMTHEHLVRRARVGGHPGVHGARVDRSACRSASGCTTPAACSCSSIFARAAPAAVHRPRHRAPARVPPAAHRACPPSRSST